MVEAALYVAAKSSEVVCLNNFTVSIALHKIHTIHFTTRKLQSNNLLHLSILFGKLQNISINHFTLLKLFYSFSCLFANNEEKQITEKNSGLKTQTVSKFIDSLGKLYLCKPLWCCREAINKALKSLFMVKYGDS